MQTGDATLLIRFKSCPHLAKRFLGSGGGGGKGRLELNLKKVK